MRQWLGLAVVVCSAVAEALLTQYFLTTTVNGHGIYWFSK
jgi:hypothetical protein